MSLFSFLGGLMGCTAQSQEFKSVDVDQFENVISDPKVIRLDVRTPQEFASGHIADAINIDVNDRSFEQRASKLPKDQTIAVYCRSGNRSKKAAGILARDGYRVIELDSGINGWTRAGKPTTNEEVDVFVTPQGMPMKIHAIKHGTLAIEAGDKWIYVDPVTSGAKPVTDFSKWPKADLILVTHEHHDHLDPEAVRQLTKEGTVVIANENSAKALDGAQVMKNGDTTKALGIAISAVPAYNTSQDKLQFHPKGRDNGYVLDIDNLTVYIAGDTEDIPEMKELKGRVDVAFMPCNLPYTMTPEQVASAARTVEPKVLFPYHYGDTRVEKLYDLLRDTDIDVRIRQYQ